MSELKELFEMVTNKTEPDLDSWQQQETRQRRTGRNRKLGAILVAAALAVAIVGWSVVAGRDRGSTPAQQPDGVPPTALEPDVQDVAVVTLDGIPVKGIPGLPADAALLDLSPDGTTIAFVTTDDGGKGTQIATIGVDGTGMKVITSGDPSAGDPVWSPDGGEIAFVWAPNGQADLYVMDADGSNVRRITSDATEQIEPQWSPDGKTLVYVDMGKDDQVDPQFSGTADIWTVPSNGGTPTQLTSEDGPDAYPDYSPDGTQIVYGRSNALMALSVKDNDRQRLHATVGFPFSPRWSPDGSRIAYGVWDPSYRPTVPFNGESYAAPLLIVNVLDVAKGLTEPVGDVGTIYDINPPVWWSNDQLMIRRVGH